MALTAQHVVSESKLNVHVATFLLQDQEVRNKHWYAGACDRKTADEALLRSSQVRSEQSG